MINIIIFSIYIIYAVYAYVASILIIIIILRDILNERVLESVTRKVITLFVICIIDKI